MMRRGHGWLAAAASLWIACGGSDAKPGSASGQDAGSAGDAGASQTTARGAALVSAPPQFALPGEVYRYRPKANGALTGLSLAEGPAGMSVREDALGWEATEAQVGRHRVVIEGDTARGHASQEYLVDVGGSTVRARGTISAVEGGRVVASSSDALHFRGVGVAVPARAVADSVEISVSELDRAPRMPNAARLRAVRFEPAGTTFDTPAQVSLPLDEGATGARRRLSAYVYDPAGRWARVPVIAVDLDNHLLIARAQHFSVYAATEAALPLTAVLTSMRERSPCAGSLVATATVDAPLAQIEADSVSSLPESLLAELPAADASLRDLLVSKAFRGSLRAVQVFELRDPGSELPSEQALSVATLFASGDGSVVVTHSDALGNALASMRKQQSAQGIDALEEVLQGRTTTVRFDAQPVEGMSLSVRVYLAYAEGDASLEPIDADDLGIAAVDADPVPFDPEADPPADVDCDGVLDGFDPTDDSLSPQVAFSPREVARAFAGEPVILRARADGASGEGTWSVLDGEGAELAAVREVSDGRAFSASGAGRYLVGFRAGTLEHVFAIDVSAPPASNTAPTCRPLKSTASARVGEPVDLSAVAADAETEASALRVEWGLYDTASKRLTASPTLIPFGTGARLLPAEPGAYVLGCRAFDGLLQGAIGTVELTVAPQSQNRPPEIAVSPPETTLVVGQSVALRAFARDPDGDALSVRWKVDGQDAPSSGSGEDSRSDVTGSKVGNLTVTVEVSDGKATGSAVALIHVRDPSAPAVDLDGDGYAAGIDCNDAEPAIHPNADERCNALDDDCDGQADEQSACGAMGCPPGTTQDGKGGCQDIDECAVDNGGCDALTKCTNTPGGRLCSACPPGYAGAGATGCADIDECMTVQGACDPRTECSNEKGGYRCGACPPGYLGTGSSGCVALDACAIDNGGCDPLTKCANTNEGRTCGACPRGYVGSGDAKCTDVDECASNNGGCDAQVKCTNTPGAFTCGGCPPGYVGGSDGKCVDVDECAIDNGGCDRLTKCANTPGGRTCGACPTGYVGSGETGCKDLDECASGKAECDGGRVCANRVDGYDCVCPPGFGFDGKTCADVDECTSAVNPCGGSMCTNTVGSYTCGCAPGTFDHAGDGKLCAQATELTAGEARTCATTSTYAAFCWGVGAEVPERVDANNDWSTISRTWHTCGVRESLLYCWGNNNDGELGLGSTGDRPTPEMVGQSRGWQRVAAGMYHTCALHAGELFCWGLNDAGQVATSVQTRAALNPLRVGELSDWTSVTSGASHSCAIRLGMLFCWGNNDSGATGSTSINKVQSDVRQVGLDRDWTAVAAGYRHTCGIRAKGRLFCWGSNDRGQAGLGDVTGTNGEPLQVGADDGWTEVSASDSASCGIRAGRMYCWGEIGKLTSSRVPQPIGKDAGWTHVVSGVNHHCGVRAGALYCWGQNDQGQLGNGTDKDSLEPVPVVTTLRK